MRPFPGTGGKWQISAGDGLYPRWTPDQRRIFFTTSVGQVMVAECETGGAGFRPGKLRPWGDVHVQLPVAPEVAGGAFNMSLDGSRLLGRAFTPPREDAQTGGRVTLLLNFFDELKRTLP